MNKKLVIYIALGLIVFIAIICFASEIQIWFMSKLTSMLILVITFAAGWLLGYFNSKSNQKKGEIDDNTEAQK